MDHESWADELDNLNLLSSHFLLQNDFAPWHQRIAEKITKVLGSWQFVLIQTFLLVTWLFINISNIWIQWDPYPFILLNLMLSFQAAYTAPIILMSQSRQGDLDRRRLDHLYQLIIDNDKRLKKIDKKIDQVLARQKPVSCSCKTLQ
jgi:uncharacterized membrane protein